MRFRPTRYSRHMQQYPDVVYYPCIFSRLIIVLINNKSGDSLVSPDTVFMVNNYVLLVYLFFYSRLLYLTS
jgi:hypothetical protein